jgi:hypothetical protein
VKFPTGGYSPRAARKGVSRFGEIPKPTVKVRMKESDQYQAFCVCSVVCLG